MQLTRFKLVFLWLALLASCLSSIASAQYGASAGEIALARQEFVLGVTAAQADDWEGALAHFERSYALYPRAETQFNIAGTHRQLGHAVAASEAYRKTLLAPREPDDGDRRVQAEAALRELTPRLPMVTLEVAGIAPGDRMLLDGQPINEAVLSVKLPVEPGTHVFVVERAEAEVARREFQAQPEAHIVVLATVSVMAPRPVATPEQAARMATPEHEPSRPVDAGPRRRRVWLWSGVGMVAVGALTTALWLSFRTQPDEPADGNLGPGSVSVR